MNELEELKKALEEKEELILLLKDAVQLRNHKIEKLEEEFINEKTTV